MRHTKKDKKESIELLRELLKPGDTLYFVIDQVSASGMSRHMKVFLAQPGGGLRRITYNVAAALGENMLEKPGHYGCFRVTGCGMDMCFHTAYTLGVILFGSEIMRDSKNYLKAELL